jgi:hypothetical protein
MKSLRQIILGSIRTSILVVATGSLQSEQIQTTGEPGSPSGTTTISGTQLPPPPPKFGGVIKENAKDSTPWWPPKIVPPKGAPNVLLIMTDDSVYGVPIFLMNQDAVDWVNNSRGWEIGTGPSMIIVDKGMARSLTTDTLHSGIYAFTFDQRGLMAGLGLQGSKIMRLD